MSRTSTVLGGRGESGRPVLTLVRGKATPARGTISAAHLMATNSHLGLPSLEEIKADQRFLADDSEAITLAEIFGWTSVTTRVVGSSFWENL